MSRERPVVSILVKALNEERRIAKCLAAAVREAHSVDGEVVLVDSLSQDRTVEIVRSFPVRIVQFASAADVGCGAAVQLGYQFINAEFVYVLDADMILQEGFIADALQRMRGDPSLAGVAGKLLDTRVRTAADERRLAAATAQAEDLLVSELGGGGLYRTAAIASTGYLAHAGLKAYEELELAARLWRGGWKLLRLARTSVLHEGHDETTWHMMRRLWRNGRARAAGVALRSAVGRPWFWTLWRRFAFLLQLPIVYLAASTLALSGGGPFAALAIAILGYWFALSLRHRSLRRGAWAVLLAHFYLACALIGFAGSVRDPKAPIRGRDLTATPTPPALVAAD